jgi:hypothetical protein
VESRAPQAGSTSPPPNHPRASDTLSPDP